MGQLLTMSEMVATHARLQPQRVAARDSKRTLTWAQWDERATRLANALLGLGLVKGDRVALLAYNTLEWLEIYAALARAGLVAVPLNFRLRGPEIAYIVEHSEAQAIVVQDDLLGVVEPERAALTVPAGRLVRLGGAGEREGWRNYEALLAAAEPTPPALAVQPNDLFALMYTSGTTGRPKGAMRSHEGNALLALVTALEFGLSRDDHGLLVMPLCHANSLYFLLTFTMLGAQITVDDRRSFDPEALLALLSRERITFTSLVPTHYIMMLDLPAEVKAKYDLAAVGKLLISSAPARRETKLAIHELFPNGRLFELYGSTEAGWVTVLRPDEQLTHPGSVGREWAGSGPIRLLDHEGREVPDGEVGELHSRTAYVFDGYWKNPEKTAEAFHRPPGLGLAEPAPRGGEGSRETRDAFHGPWCSVGDMARRDEQGYIHLVDRKSNMIISGGENIYPSEVEAVLAAHPAVQDVAVVGLPDAKWGETVCAVVVPRPGLAVDEATLVDWCRDRIAGYKRPRSVRIVSEGELPRTATGKIQHRVLRDRLAAG
ncbi:MAG: AMP-binding protein [Rubrivivax sp.]|nr:AMP-binding protein [Rubrivivax sp.]